MRDVAIDHCQGIERRVPWVEETVGPRDTGDERCRADMVVPGRQRHSGEVEVVVHDLRRARVNGVRQGAVGRHAVGEPPRRPGDPVGGVARDDPGGVVRRKRR